MAEAPQPEPTIRLRGVSRWYGEILGVNKVSVDFYPGITGLVGPNGSGKSTLMNIICGVLRASQGEATIYGEPVWNNSALRRRVGLCSQVDHFYENFTGRQFVEALLALHGHGREWTRRTASEGLARVGMSEHQSRRLKAYSKGMRQRVKIALALAHQPDVLVLDEPFNGLDPVGRHEMMRLFEDYAREGRTILLSSHILHEIEQMTDRVLMVSNGYVLAEGDVRQVRGLLQDHPFQVFVRCNQPRHLAARLLPEPHVQNVSIENGSALTISTTDPDAFYLTLNALALEDGMAIDIVTLADENMQSIYQYLSGREHH